MLFLFSFERRLAGCANGDRDIGGRRVGRESVYVMIIYGESVGYRKIKSPRAARLRPRFGELLPSIGYFYPIICKSTQKIWINCHNKCYLSFNKYGKWLLC